MEIVWFQTTTLQKLLQALEKCHFLIPVFTSPEVTQSVAPRTPSQCTELTSEDPLLTSQGKKKKILK